MKNELINKVIGLATDNADPKHGSVFEKQVEIDFATFTVFIVTQYDCVTMETHENENSICYLFYSDVNGDRTRATNHCASYIIPKNNYLRKPYGVFGGSRIGSENVAWNDTGVALLEKAFQVRY